MLKKIWRVFFNKRSNRSFDALDRQRGLFHPPDVAYFQDHLDIVDTARAHGQANRPTCEAYQKDATSVAIDSALSTLIVQGKTDLIAYISGARDLTVIQSRSNQQEAEAVRQRTLSDLHEEAKTGLIELFPLKSDMIRGARALKVFRDVHCLTRNAESPDSVATGVGLIALAALLETALNAITLSDAHPAGLIGVGMEVFLFTFCNISLACILGSFILRSVNHVSPIRRRVSGVLAVVCVGLLVLMNLLFAHYRDSLLVFSFTTSDTQYLEQSFQIMTKSLVTLGETPFVLSDFKSLTLFAVGCLLAFAACTKAYRLDDPYPGYGRLNRQQKKQAALYLDMISIFFQSLSDIAENGVKDLNDLTLKQTRLSDHMAQRRTDVQELTSQFQSWLTLVESCGQSLYATYREVNETHRTTTRPPCFDIEYRLPQDARQIDLQPLQSLDPPGPDTTGDNTGRIEMIYQALAEYRDQFKTLENFDPDADIRDPVEVPLAAIDQVSRKYAKYDPVQMH